MNIPLYKIAFARSGDKNDRSNIGILAREKRFYKLLVSHLTVEFVTEQLGGLVEGNITRYEWPAIEGLNFVCEQALDGGGSRSLRMDNLGKNLSSLLLTSQITLSQSEIESLQINF